MVDTKKINKTIRAIKSVARQSTKVVGAALPIATVVVNGLESWKLFPNNPAVAVRDFIGKYSGVDSAGNFSGERFMTGTGALVFAGLAGWIINQVT